MFGRLELSAVYAVELPTDSPAFLLLLDQSISPWNVCVWMMPTVPTMPSDQFARTARIQSECHGQNANV